MLKLSTATEERGKMTDTLIQTNIRQRILACANFRDFLSENAHLNVAIKDGEAADYADDCEQLSAWFGNALSVREKLQILSLYRGLKCPMPHVDSELIGVVIEFGNEFGIDALAVYSDLQGAWYSGRDRSLMEVDLSVGARAAYQRFRDAVSRAIQHCVPHPTEIPPPPPPGYIAISFLSERGIAYALGASRDIAVDGISGPIVYLALAIRELVLGTS